MPVTGNRHGAEYIKSLVNFFSVIKRLSNFFLHKRKSSNKHVQCLTQRVYCVIKRWVHIFPIAGAYFSDCLVVTIERHYYVCAVLSYKKWSDNMWGIRTAAEKSEEMQVSLLQSYLSHKSIIKHNKGLIFTSCTVTSALVKTDYHVNALAVSLNYDNQERCNFIWKNMCPPFSNGVYICSFTGRTHKIKQSFTILQTNTRIIEEKKISERV